jgi:hypothetical protein
VINLAFCVIGRRNLLSLMALMSRRRFLRRFLMGLTSRKRFLALARLELIRIDLTLGGMRRLELLVRFEFLDLLFLVEGLTF